MRIFMIGYMGAGKSTTGKRLARRLAMPFVDLDDAFEARYRYSIPRFFERFGEAKFREFEHACLLGVIAGHHEAVISTGGGTACHHDHMAVMNAAGITVYLKMHPASLAQRLNRARRLRPLVRDVKNDDMQAFIEKQLSARGKFYEQAQLIVKGENLDLDALVKEVNTIIGR
jgi:shikimate kinase